jgi:hypothetical protein
MYVNSTISGASYVFALEFTPRLTSSSQHVYGGYFIPTMTIPSGKWAVGLTAGCATLTVSAGAGTFASIYAAQPTGLTGTLGTDYGIYIEARTRASTNYAIYTAGQGIVRFGDRLTVDQASSTAAQPVLFLDQGDVSEQCIQFSSDATDRDIHLFTVNVTGAPAMDWLETPDIFSLNKGLKLTGTLDTDGFIGNTVEKSSGYTATATDYAIMCDASGGGFTITLPAAASHTGRVYHIKKIDLSGNIVTVDGNSSETIDDATTAVLTTQYESITIQSDGDEWFIL